MIKVEAKALEVNPKDDYLGASAYLETGDYEPVEEIFADQIARHFSWQTFTSIRLACTGLLTWSIGPFVISWLRLLTRLFVEPEEVWLWCRKTFDNSLELYYSKQGEIRKMTSLWIGVYSQELKGDWNILSLLKRCFRGVYVWWNYMNISFR